MASVTPRSVLGTLTRPRLRELSECLDQSAPRSATKEKLVESLATLTLPVLLAELKFDELKKICRTLKLDAGGRQKAALLARLLVAQEPATTSILEPAKAPAPTLQKRGGVNVDQAGDVQIKANRDLIAGDQIIHNHGAHPTAPVDFDLQRHLSRLLPEVDHINITGIRSRPGASRDALRRPIEELYTPLRSHRPRERDEQSPNPESERIELPELLRTHHRLLLEGQPGSGKTTFLNLVTCMLARDLSPGITGPADAPSWSEKHLGLTGPARIPGLVRIAQLVPLLIKDAAGARGDDRRWLMHLLALRTCPEEQLALDPGDPGHQHRCKQWDALLTDGQAVLLLDGLDEVADEGLRERVFKIFRDACTTWNASQILVTSRPIQTEALQRMGFHKATIDAFEPEEVKRFVHQWSSALHEEKAPESSAHRAGILLNAIATRGELRDLAANPVMLTCLCVVHWNEGGLPEGRARVYHAVFGWMLRSRKEARDAAGYSTEFAEYAFPSLALAMMVGPQGKRARIDFWQAAAALDADVAREFPSETRRRHWARTWLLRECEWSHIIEEVDGDELKFWHLTMQEFAAALALAQRRDGDGDQLRDWWPIVREHLDHPQWRETIALLPGCLYDEGGRTRVDKLVERVLAEGDTGALVDAARSVGVLGRILPTMRAYKYRIDPALAARLRTLQARAMELFTPEGATQVPVQVRIAAAEALGAAGFPRPAGEYLELPGKGLSLGKFPVTVAEYAEFVAAGGYADAGNWDAEGLRFQAEYGWTEPGSWDSQQEHPTRPVVEVSWCEARAYCRWLERRLGHPVRLPLAAEWEYAATPDGREYPWGAAKPDDDLANFKQDVGRPTPVGVYPRGAGKFGHQDLAGNVWEWCEDGEPEPDAKRWERWGDQYWLKGGSWWHDEGALAAGCRHWYGSWDRGDFGGFRVVVSAIRFDL
jgi:hypothetical protein